MDILNGTAETPNYTITEPPEHESKLNIEAICCAHKSFLFATRNFNGLGLIDAFDGQVCYK